MDEQGVESIQAHLINLERTHQAIPNEVNQIGMLNEVDLHHEGAHA